MKKLTSRFSMILGGNFIDNYSAGSQRYRVAVGEENIWYSQPYRYTTTRQISLMCLSYVFILGYHLTRDIALTSIILKQIPLIMMEVQLLDLLYNNEITSC